MDREALFLSIVIDHRKTQRTQRRGGNASLLILPNDFFLDPGDVLFDTAPRAREPVTFFIDPFGERQIAHLVLAEMGIVTAGV